jgi:hypothetical protein
LQSILLLLPLLAPLLLLVLLRKSLLPLELSELLVTYVIDRKSTSHSRQSDSTGKWHWQQSSEVRGKRK